MPRYVQILPVNLLNTANYNQKGGWVLDADAGQIFEAD